MRLLLVEDDDLLADGISKLLSRRGYEVQWAHDGRSALAAVEEGRPDLILLDINLPDLSGVDVLKILRSREYDTPVLVITARESITDRVELLDSGADDYLVKPVNLDELCARIRAVTRRAFGDPGNLLTYKDLEMDVSSKTISIAGQPIKLSAREFALLKILLENCCQVISRQLLETELYGPEVQVASNSLEVHIHNLRKKLPDKIIHTVHGVGYILRK